MREPFALELPLDLESKFLGSGSEPAAPKPGGGPHSPSLLSRSPPSGLLHQHGDFAGHSLLPLAIAIENDHWNSPCPGCLDNLGGGVWRGRTSGSLWVPRPGT